MKFGTVKFIQRKSAEKWKKRKKKLNYGIILTTVRPIV